MRRSRKLNRKKLSSPLWFCLAPSQNKPYNKTLVRMKVSGKPNGVVLELTLLNSPDYLIDEIKSVYRKAVEEGVTYQEAAAALGTPKAAEAAERLLLFEKHYNRLSSDELYMELCVLPEVERSERPLFWDKEEWY